MLQQTRVHTVIPYWERFLSVYPSVHALADAPLDGVLSLWSGLGYYRRARMLHEGARDVVRLHGGAFPDTSDGLEEIRGIGRYTAGAIASIAFGRKAALVDGNVARVLARVFAVRQDVRGGPGLARIWEIARALVSERDPGSWNQALMELGATVCTPRSPRCSACPVRAACDARAAGVEEALPVLARKASPTLVRRVALVATRAGAVLLGKRRAGLFGGLWEPPMVDVEEPERAIRARFEALLGGGARLGALAKAGKVVHVLSHRRLEIEVMRCSLRSALVRVPTRSEYEAFELVGPPDMDGRAMATLGRKVLAAAKVE
jgi:A/G-specific adenine glycosylase